MKLKTKMEGRVVAVKTLHDNVNGVISDLGHDAAVAHALLSAIEDVKQQNDVLTATDAVWYVEKRAGEILKGWGYEDGR